MPTPALALLLSLPAPTPAQEETRNVAILVYPGVELLDLSGPGEVFSAAHVGASHNFRVYTVWKDREPLESQGFLGIVPGHSFADAPRPDVVVLPGGRVPADDQEVVAWVRDVTKEAEVVMSVCNGAHLLAAAGLLDGLEVTTHRSALGSLQRRAPNATVLVNRRFVDSGPIVTTAGVSAGIDGALHVVARLLGESAAHATARYMEYDWRPRDIAALHATPGQRPGEAIARLLGLVREEGLEAALASYEEQRAKPEAGLARLQLAESDLNEQGYALLRAERLEEAVELFRFAAAAHPASPNARDSLAEALEAAGHDDEAVAAAEASLALLEEDGALSPVRRERLITGARARLERLRPARPVRYACPPCAGGCDETSYEAPGTCPTCGMRLELAGD